MLKLQIVLIGLLTVGSVNCLNNFLVNLNVIKKYVPKADEMVSSVCYPEIESCFNQNPIYDLKNRKLIFYTPQTPMKLNLRFHMLNRPDDDIEKSFHFYFNNLTDRSDQLLGQIQFSSNQQTLVFIPGWTEEYADSKHWIQSLDGWSTKDNYQLIVVDWSDCSLKCTYEEAVTNSKVISKVLSIVLFQLNLKSKIDLSKTHLIGKDLGGHIAGQVGNELTNRKIKLFKITAFDPPLDLFEERTDIDKIDLHDANHVEIIHTNTNRNEFMQGSIGLVDVFVYDYRPNGQLSSQFGNQSRFSSNSEIDLKMRSAIRDNLSLRTEKDCHLLAFRCDNYQTFLDGKCSLCDGERNCKLIGLWSNQLSTRFEKSGKPFQYYSIQNTEKTPCVYHYQIQVTIGPIFKNRKSKGIIEMTIQNETVSIQDEFSRNQTYTKLFTSFKPLNDLKHIKITWINLAAGLWVFTYSNAIHIDRIKLNYLSSLDEKIRQDYSLSYCLSNLGTNVIAHKQFINLKKCS